MAGQKTKSQIGRGSRQKGQRGERDVIKLLKQHFPEWEFKRTPMSGGWGGSPEFKTCGDIVTNCPDWAYTIEVKHQKALSFLHVLQFSGEIKEWFTQVMQDAKKNNNTPLLVFRRNNVPWYVLTFCDTFIDSHALAHIRVKFEYEGDGIMHGIKTALAFVAFNTFLEKYKEARQWNYKPSSK